jgi:hypothetical protein
MHGTLRSLAKASSSQSLAFCLLVIVAAFEVFAQSASTGALTGTVTDQTGAVVPKATITLRDNGTRQLLTAVTDLEGLYRFSLLPPGQYELRVEMAGFAPLTLREVTIQISEVRRIPIKLAVQGTREEVESPLLQTEGRVIDGSTTVALPLVNRNYTQILDLTRGTNTDVVDATQLGAVSQEIRANGARGGDNNFMPNGVDSNSYGANMTEATSPSGGGLAIPAPDTIQDFKVQNSLYDAQYGRGGGANVRDQVGHRPTSWDPDELNGAEGGTWSDSCSFVVVREPIVQRKVQRNSQGV